MKHLNIKSALAHCKDVSSYGRVSISKGFFTPVYIVIISAYIKEKQITNQDQFRFNESNQFNYLKRIKFFQTLWNLEENIEDDSSIGKSYSPLTLLDSEDATNIVATQMCGCINNLVDNTSSEGIRSLKDVIGELLDNVWSHGRTTGFSMAQRNNNIIEFALADYGGGFLKELKRVKIDINDDESAIKWCLKKGNSSKKVEVEQQASDGWEQALPTDCLNNPMGKFAQIRKSNHHAGLGLGKLIDLVKRYKGDLDLVSGMTQYSIKNGSIDSPNIINISSFSNEWKGVIIRCRFDISKLNENIPLDNQDALNDITNSLSLKSLR